jgi:hypothetical protein
MSEMASVRESGTDNGLNELRIEVCHRFDLVDQKFVAIDQKFASVDQRFASVDQRFDRVEDQILGLRGDLSALGLEMKRRRSTDRRIRHLRRGPTRPLGFVATAWPSLPRQIERKMGSDQAVVGEAQRQLEIGGAGQ